MDKEHIKNLVWEGLLDADFRSRYFGYLAGHLQSSERIITIIVGVLSSGAFISLITKFHLDYIPPILSLLTAFFSIVLANLKLGKSAALSAALHSKWSSIKNQYEVLWGEIEHRDAGEISNLWQAIEAEHRKEDETAAQEFKLKRRLAKKCQNDVLRMRHLAGA